MTPVSPHSPIASRVQLAINVEDVDAAVVFYSQLFDAEPHKRRPGYANFALTEPPLKLVLIENPGHGGTLNTSVSRWVRRTKWRPLQRV